MPDVVLNQAAIDAYGRGAAAEALLAQLGAQVADDARANAPKRTGAGAASIGHEVGEDSRGAYVRVSWDSAHWYMVFSELGTSRMPARPFLRPALMKRRTL